MSVMPPVVMTGLESIQTLKQKAYIMIYEELINYNKWILICKASLQLCHDLNHRKKNAFFYSCLILIDAIFPLKWWLFLVYRFSCWSYQICQPQLICHSKLPELSPAYMNQCSDFPRLHIIQAQCMKKLEAFCKWCCLNMQDLDHRPS